MSSVSLRPGRAVEVEHLPLAGRGAHIRDAEARHPAHLRIDHHLHERGGDGRVVGVAALAQDLYPLLNRWNLRRDDHTAHGTCLSLTHEPLPQ
jgi:hypothetical protein